MMTAAASHDTADVVAFCLERGVVVTESDMVSIASIGSFANHQILIRARAVDINYCIEWLGDLLSVATTFIGSFGKKLGEVLSRKWRKSESQQDRRYKTVLAAAAKDGRQDMVELLLQHGARLRGSGAIVLAAEAGQMDMVRLLLAKGVDVNKIGVEDPTDERSKVDVGTPLHGAIINGHVDTATLLILAGASLELKDFLGRTPNMLAEQCHQTEYEIRYKTRKQTASNSIAVGGLALEDKELLRNLEYCYQIDMTLKFKGCLRERNRPSGYSPVTTERGNHSL